MRGIAVLAPALFVAGLVLVAVAIGALAGLWWGVLVGGIVLVGVAVLTQLATPAAPAETEPAP